MRFLTPLLPGRLIKRYKRFLADIELDSGNVITAHCANPGALLGGTSPGLRVWVSYAPAPSRKLSYSWQLVEMDDTFVGINTSLPNDIAEEAIRTGQISELADYELIKREVKYGQNSRIDLLLSSSHKPLCYVEVKNVHLKRGNTAEFPDSITTRGTKHLKELAKIASDGGRAVMLYIIQRKDCKSFRFAADIDPLYANTAIHAQKAGVEMLAYTCDVTPDGITIHKRISHICP